MKKFLACVLSASMMLGLLAGCAGAGSSSGNAPAGSGAAVSTPAVSGDNVLKIGVFEPSTGDSASGGKKEMLGMQYANSETPTVTVGGQEYQIQRGKETAHHLQKSIILTNRHHSTACCNSSSSCRA